MKRTQEKLKEMGKILAENDKVKEMSFPPRTIKEYSENVNRFPEWFRKLPVSDITQAEINKLVNEISKGQIRAVHAVMGGRKKDIRSCQRYAI